MFILPVLLAAALVLLLVPAWRRRFTWGRGADRYPITGFGCAGVTVALFIMTIGGAIAHFQFLPPTVGYGLALLGFLVLLAVGLLDRPRPLSPPNPGVQRTRFARR